MRARRAAARWSSRRRDWLRVLAVLALLGVYWAAWVGYATVHTVTRYVAAAPGAAAGSDDGQSLRVLSLVRTDTLLSENAGEAPQIATASGEFVVARVEITVDRPTDYGRCQPELLGPDERVWQPMTIPDVSRAAESTCADLVPGRPVQVEVLYEIPRRFGDQLRGLAVNDPGSAAPAVVITPSA